MAHRTVKSGYAQLVERLNRAPQGAPPSKLLNRILAMLMNEQEAGLLALLPIKPFTARKAARIWKMGEAQAERVCRALAGRALLVDIERRGRSIYVLPPPMAGFFEFSLMRTRGDLDQKTLSELFHQYLNVEEDFVKALFTEGETQLGRVFVQEPVLSNEQRRPRAGLRARQRGDRARPATSASACATAATRCCTWAAPATRPWTSA